MEIKRADSRKSGEGPAEWFTGTIRIDPLCEAPEPARVRGASVTFEPGARTAWHTHPLDQTLIVTSGLGWAQREDGPIEEIRPGDVIWFAPNEKHWHGAADAKWNGNDWVAVWHHRKWGDEDLVVYEIANDKIKREEKIWPDVVKYFDRDWQRRYLKKYPSEKDSYTFRADDPGVVTFEFKDHKLSLNIFAENRPNLAPGPHWSAELHGIWDLDKAKFDKVDFKPGEISIRKPEE